MFRDLNLKSSYSSNTDNIEMDFFLPVFGASIKYDCVIPLFSKESIFGFLKMLEVHGTKINSCRLVVVVELGKDFIQIKNGNNLRKFTKEYLFAELFKQLSTGEKKCLSNFVYLISKGSLDL